MLTRITPKEIGEIPLGKQTEHRKSQLKEGFIPSSEVFRVVAQAQLEADQEKVQEIIYFVVDWANLTPHEFESKYDTSLKDKDGLCISLEEALKERMLK